MVRSDRVALLPKAISSARCQPRLVKERFDLLGVLFHGTYGVS